MRLWSIHPCYLDTKGLVALWREALLAQAVLHNKTRGYQNHPQLVRYRQHPNPTGAIATYLRAVYNEAEQRGYNFDKTRILPGRASKAIRVTNKQLQYEVTHLRQKLKQRDPVAYSNLMKVRRLEPHPLFKVGRGPVETWEKVV